MRASPRVCAGLAALAAGACASSEPVVLNSSFTSNGRLPWVNHPAKSEVALPPPCTISVGEVVDGRADTQSMGSFGDRYVRHENTVGWVRSGLDTLGGDRRFRVVPAANAGDGIVLNVTLLKAYLQGLAVSKNATVVLHVSYTRAGTPAGENTYRGDTTDMNWTSSDNEASDALNQALREALNAIDGDLRKRCDQPSTASS